MKGSYKMETQSLKVRSEVKRSLASCVKFSADEYEKINADANLAGITIPMLLKTAYFSGRRVRILMDKENQKDWYRELRHWGNNLNQLARKVNAGLMTGWYEEFQLVRTMLDRIEKLVVGTYGNR